MLIIILFPVFQRITTQNKYKNSSHQLKEVMKLIYRQTGWSAETAMNRIFTVEFKTYQSFVFPYLLACRGRYKKTE